MTQSSGVRIKIGPAIFSRYCALLQVFILALVCNSHAQTNLPPELPELPDSVQLKGFLEHPAIIESSGLVASRQYPGVFWTHNDDGEQFLFAIDETGRHLGAFQVQGATLIDWEAISTDDRGNLYLADIGADGIPRTYSAIHRVEEPDPADRFGPARIEQSWFVRFPGARQDCESFFVLNGYGYLVTKARVGGMVSMWRFLMGSATFSTLEFVTSIETDGDVADASLSPDARRLAFVTDDGVEVFFINGNPASISREARADTELNLEDMEGVAFGADGLLVTRDGSRELLSFESDQLTGQPVFTRPLADQTVFVGENVLFSVVVEGFPQATFAWYFNGQLIPGATNSTLVLTNVTLAQAGIYQVIASNANGSARSVARLAVRERLFDVRITEVMPSQRTGDTNLLKKDWWELTSFDNQPINLAGWRFNDRSGTFSDAFVIPDVTSRPGESIIFVEDLSPDEFQEWWGEQNFAPGTQIITYSGSELSFAADGDQVRLWSPDVTNAVYTEVSFGPADPGVSFGFNPVTQQFGEKSVAGVNGAFLSVDALDVASPGRIRNPPPTETADIRITEVMSSEAPGAFTKRDWFELTSFHPTPVDLNGWRFNDSSGGFADAYIITNTVIIQPGESIVFVEDLSAPEFLAWWGPTNFAPGTQIITYSGTQLSFSSAGDSLSLWAPTNSIPVAEVDIDPATPGVSFGYNPATGDLDPSVPGVRGAFLSADGLDVGSPGRIDGQTPVPSIDIRITEVMSSEAPGGPAKEDWFELTNFEDAAINLTGWRFNDDTGGFAEAYIITNNVIIQPGESVVFVENLSPQAFIAWWGTTNFAPATQIITYPGTGLGFNSDGDRLYLWTPTNSIPVAQEDIDPATVGFSFGYNPETGEFGDLSQEGVFGAFRSVDGADIGSPGRIQNPGGDTIDLRITEVMSSEVTTAVPVEDWWELTSFDTQPIDISGWRFNDATNGLADAFVIPAGTIIQPGQSVIFVENLTSNEFLAWWGPEVPAGTPIITYSGPQLSFAAGGDEVKLWTDQATNDDDVFTGEAFGAAAPGFSFGYDPDLNAFGERSQIGVHGAFRAISGPDVGSPGKIRGEAQPTLDLRITEVMSSPAPETPTSADWWELTSFHNEPVNIGGWRFNDNNPPELADAFIIPDNTFIQPGESIIFVRDLTPAEFLTWWGPANFPAGTQIITYSGVQIGFDDNGDWIYLWDNAATGDADVFTQVAFGSADPGVSFGYDPDRQYFGDKSEPGVNGAFVAATGPDIGSPGRIRSTGQIRTQISAAGMQIEIRNPGIDSYAVETSKDLSSNSWIPTGEVLQSTNGTSILLNKPLTEPKAFYRVRKL